MSGRIVLFYSKVNNINFFKHYFLSTCASCFTHQGEVCIATILIESQNNTTYIFPAKKHPDYTESKSTILDPWANKYGFYADIIFYHIHKKFNHKDLALIQKFILSGVEVCLVDCDGFLVGKLNENRRNHTSNGKFLQQLLELRLKTASDYDEVNHLISTTNNVKEKILNQMYVNKSHLKTLNKFVKKSINFKSVDKAKWIALLQWFNDNIIYGDINDLFYLEAVINNLHLKAEDINDSNLKEILSFSLNLKKRNYDFTSLKDLDKRLCKLSVEQQIFVVEKLNQLFTVLDKDNEAEETAVPPNSIESKHVLHRDDLCIENINSLYNNIYNYLGKELNPSIKMKAIKVLTIIIISLVSSVIVAIFFSAGFGIGAWAGVGAILSGIYMASIGLKVASACSGAIIGAITAYGLFKTPKVIDSLKTLHNEKKAFVFNGGLDSIASNSATDESSSSHQSKSYHSVKIEPDPSNGLGLI